jgi:hypothetical protein
MYTPSVVYSYTTLEAVKAHIPEGSALADPLIEELISRVSRDIDRYKRVPDSYYNNGGGYAVAETFYFDGNGKASLWVYPCTRIDLVRVREAAGTTWEIWVAGTDFYSWPYNREHVERLDIYEGGDQSVWPAGQRTVEVTAVWGGFESTPPEVEEACIIEVARTLGRGQQMFRDVGAITELSQLRYTKDLDPQARAILDKLPGRAYVG